MSEQPQLQRRAFLRFAGAGVTSLAMGWIPISCVREPKPDLPADALGSRFVSPPYPVPMPGQENVEAASFERYEVLDTLVLPDGFEWRVVAKFGDRFGSARHQIDFGTNADYTGLLPKGDADDEFWLLVNHEYVSPRPWFDSYAAVYGTPPPQIEVLRSEAHPSGAVRFGDWLSVDRSINLDDERVPAEIRDATQALAQRILSEMGVTVLHVRRNEDGHFTVVEDSTDHRRISTAGSQNVDPAQRPVLTGPATALLGTETPGTMCNCSGGTTPWGTFLTCEENFQNQVVEKTDAAGRSLPAERRLSFVPSGTDPRPSMIDGSGLVAFSEPLDGRRYGWVTEVDPEVGSLRKHTALGRFRHENVSLRVEAGKPLAAYMGDDRRGGHVWKFISDKAVRQIDDPENTKLLEQGTLYAASFDKDWSGRWIPLRPETPLVRPRPEQCSEGFLYLPDRERVGTVRVATEEAARRSRSATMSADEWCSSIERFAGIPFEECSLLHLVAPELRERPDSAQAVILIDAFAMANAVGATPTARPEDVEVHPVDASVFIAFTDATGGSDGSPSLDMFPDADRRNSRQYGALWRLTESVDDLDFHWGRFLASGDVVEEGGGFACADNLAFDAQANLWMVTDISTTALNFPVRADDENTSAGSPGYRGVFGNNSLFRIPTQGPDSGVPRVFGIGPVDSELTGPTFTDDGRTLLLSVQHPGERGGTRTASNASRDVEIDLTGPSGERIRQKRTVPNGSNFPSGELDSPPRSCVVSICRTTSPKTST
ncbi:MAG: alkaline phosphatase PhoX [Acidobacteriota bacterium]